MRRKNWFHLDEPGFDSTYFLQVLSGVKNICLGIFVLGINLAFFRSGIKLDKQYILSKMKGNPTYGEYVPDNCNPAKLSKDFLLNLVAYIDLFMHHTKSKYKSVLIINGVILMLKLIEIY